MIRLNPREKEYIEAILKGGDHAQIARRLSVTRATFRNAVGKLSRKLGITPYRYTLTVRIAYIVSKSLGLLPGWPD
jgi:DNA-binding CsgD family transcriptional regulator